MKPREIKAERTRMGYTQKDVANKLNMNYYSYRNKENGRSRFTEDEKIALADVLHLSLYQMNDFLFDGKLPIGINENRNGI